MNSPRDARRGRRRLPVIPEDRDLELKTCLQLVRTFTRVERKLDHAAERHGLSLAQFDVLVTLGRDEGITQQQLAERLLVTKGNVCGLIDRMTAAGWVERRPDPEDRRANRLFLTARGRELLAETMPDNEAAVKEMMTALQPGELRSLYVLLERLEDALAD